MAWKPAAGLAASLLLLLNLAACAQHEAAPPHAGFVNIASADPTIRVEARYFSSDNFVGRRIDGYQRNAAFLSRQAAEALLRVHADLQSQGLGLKIFDAYRPQRAVDHFARWAADPDDTLMKARYYPDVPKHRLFELGYIAARSGHTRGSTVDLTVIDLASGQELDMGSAWDFFGEISHHDSPLVSRQATANRELLRAAMIRHGFRPYAKEWWHYTLADEPYPDTYFNFAVQ